MVKDKEFHPINFLTPSENMIMECLCKAEELFNRVCEEDPQSSTDSYNFGHYIDAAKSAVILRGARRMDPESLLPHHNSSFRDQFTTQEYDSMLSRINGMLPNNTGDEVKNNESSDGD